MGKNPGLVLCLWMIATMCVASLQQETEVLSGLKHLSSSKELAQHAGDAGYMQRKLLVEEEVFYTTPISNQTGSNFSLSGGAASKNWSILVGVLMATASFAFLIVLAIKWQDFQRFLRGGQESLLHEEETASQFSQPGTLSSSIPRYGMRDRDAVAGDREEDDDDGFIEDNYITPSEKERTEPEEENEVVFVEDSDDELDIHFSIE